MSAAARRQRRTALPPISYFLHILPVEREKVKKCEKDCCLLPSRYVHPGYIYTAPVVTGFLPEPWSRDRQVRARVEQGRWNVLKSEGAPVRRESVGAQIRRFASEKFWVVPLHFFASKSTISRFGERFRDGLYSLVSFLFAVLLLTTSIF